VYLLSSFSLGFLLTLKNMQKEMTSTTKAAVDTTIMITVLDVLLPLTEKTINLFSLEDSVG
jgi:hypothetical protein